jgi:TRAP transporter TAXI family solute receptor
MTGIRLREVLAALLALAWALPAAAESLTFMTGPAGGTWYPLGGATKQILEQEIDGLTITLRPGAGLINIKGISLGKADIAWGNVISTVDALNGKPPFEKKMGDLCNIAAFYEQVAQVPVTDLAIATIGDLKGKRLATLPRGNTTEASARALLALYGLTYDDLSKINFGSITDQVNMTKDGQIDGFVLVSSVPAAGVLDLATSRSMKLLPLPDDKFAALHEANPGWQRATIPAGTYPGQDADIPSAGFPMHMLVNCTNVSEETGYRITKALAERGGELAAVTKLLEGYGAQAMAKDVGVPFHPGALRYYRELGLM